MYLFSLHVYRCNRLKLWGAQKSTYAILKYVCGMMLRNELGVHQLRTVWMVTSGGCFWIVVISNDLWSNGLLNEDYRWYVVAVQE